MASYQVCDNPECEMPTGIMPVEIEPNIFICQRCFRAMQTQVNAYDFADSPHKTVERKRRGKGLVLLR